MTEKEYKEKLDAFKNSCRVYKHEKMMLEDSAKTAHKFGDEQLNAFLLEDITYVDDMFSEIEEKCGKSARLILWFLYVEGKTQADAADQFGLTRRQLQYSLKKWMRQVLEQE